MDNTHIVLFTDHFPFGISSENGFLERELTQLARKFDTVIIVPRLINGKRIDEESFVSIGNVVVDLTLADYLDKRKRISRLLLEAGKSKIFWRELLILVHERVRFLKRIMAALDVFAYAVAISEWLDGFILEYKIDIGNTVFYTYWFSKVTTGISFAKKKYKGLSLISRAHRFDLYIHQQPEYYFPYRGQVLELINELHLISDDGFAHILAAYPEYIEKYRVSRLGVANPGFITKSSNDGCFRLASCSYVKDVKRLDLLVAGLKSLAHSRPDGCFRWDHFGDGPSLGKIRALAEELPTNIEYVFWGNLPNRDIISYYQNNSVDVFINVSSSEGVPVSIMEAQSCGIPVIATSVGGTPEIVNLNNGILLKPDPAPTEIGEAIWILLSDTKEMSSRKKASLVMWRNSYDADVNFEKFSTQIYQLLSYSKAENIYQQ